MRNHVTDWQVQRGDDTIELTVRYDIEPYVPAKISGPPEDCYPAEGGCVTDMQAFKAGTEEPFELIEAETTEITDWIEQHHDHHADQEYARYGDPDDAYDAMRDDQMTGHGRDDMGDW